LCEVISPVDGEKEGVVIMSSEAAFPVRIEARLDPELSRWLWLVKWVLAIPHYFVLAFLWVAFALLSIVAFLAILFTGRYPRSIFEFNVGVLRWSWRVAYYAYGALGTDRYPPFTLAEVTDYPAHLEITYPERLSRGLVLVKWWLLAIPHYIIVGLLMGGTWLVWQNDAWRIASPGLIGILVLIAAIALAATGRYPTSLFDLILGFNRWVLRVAAYAGLMTDSYPPFRLDMGGSEPGTTLTVPPGAPPVPPGAAPTTTGTAVRGWSAGPISILVIGAIVALLSLGTLATGGGMLWADQTQRDSTGYLSMSEELDTPSYALVTENIDFRARDIPRALYPSSILDKARIDVTSLTGGSVFVGVARAADVDRYLGATGYESVDEFGEASRVAHAGGAPESSPTEQPFWVASSSGTGKQSLTWDVREGNWTAVVMKTDASAGVAVEARVGARIPSLPWIAAGVLAFGGLLLVAGAGLIAAAVYRASRPRPEHPAAA
jgi:hypothetical protein